MELRDLMATLRRRWIVIAVTTLAGVAIAGLVCLLTTPTYQSRIQFYVTSTGGDGSSAAYQGALASQQRVQSYAQLVGSEDVAARVVDAAHVDMTPSALAGEAEAKADPISGCRCPDRTARTRPNVRAGSDRRSG